MWLTANSSMSMAVGLSLATLYYAWRPMPTLEQKKDSVTTAMIFNVLYGLTGLSAVFYPGAMGV